MLWGYSMFPSGGFSTKPYYISRIEDKNGNVLDHFDTKRKEVISQNTAYTMCRMMQGPVDVGTAAGLRNRLGISEMGGKTGTTNDNSDAWFIGYTPQLLAGVWIGCDDRFIHMESNYLGQGAQAARPVWEYFFAKTLADRNLPLSRQVKFIQPENMKADAMYDYMNIQQTAPPGAEGNNQGNGDANQYMDTSTPKIPLDSKLSPDEARIYKEATNKKADKTGPLEIIVTDQNNKPPLPKKKKGLLGRIFGSKDN